MNQTLLLVIAVFALNSCNSQIKNVVKSENDTEILSQNFDWLLGNWIRTNEKENKKTFENWEKKSDSEYIGFSYTMQNSDTIWQERVRLVNIGNNWSFNVTQKDEREVTKFALTLIEKTKFICENQANEFPKRIEYSLVGERIEAIVSGPGMEIHFDFKKMN